MKKAILKKRLKERRKKFVPSTTDTTVQLEKKKVKKYSKKEKE